MEILMKIQIFLIVIPFLLAAAGCGETKDNPYHDILDKAERLLVHHADSAEMLLESLPDPDNLPDRDFARWCILSGKATNYTHADARTARQWERATEWLDKNGSTAERIQAHLFLGRTYAGDRDFDKAMKTYAEALDHAKTCQEYNLAGYICTYMADIYRETLLMQEVKDKYEVPLPQGAGAEARVLVVIETESFVFASTHLDHVSEAAQTAQAKLISETLKTRYMETGKPVFLCGDLNSTQNSAPISELKKDWTILSSQEPTFPSTNPESCIDFIMILDNGAEYEFVGSEVCRRFNSGDVRKASDHLPVYVDVRL